MLQWLKFTLIPLGVDLDRNIAFEHFRNTDGLALSSMTLSDFVTCSSTFGSFLYDKLQTYLRAENSVSNLYQREYSSPSMNQHRNYCIMTSKTIYFIPVLPVQSDYKDSANDVVSLMLSENQFNVPSCRSKYLLMLRVIMVASYEKSERSTFTLLLIKE